MRPRVFHLPIFVATVLTVALMFVIGFHRLEIDTDIVDDLPEDPVLQDALRVFKSHEIQDQLVVDLSLDPVDVGRLTEYGRKLEGQLRASGLFRSVGLRDFGKAIPAMAGGAARNLPLLFSERELGEQVLPLVHPEAVRKRLRELHRDLTSLDGIGQAEFIEHDPLGLMRLVIARLSSLAPTQNAYIHDEKLISSDNRHLLVIAVPLASGTDTAFSRRVVARMETISQNLRQEASERGERLTLTPVGAYRIALDNELIASRDVRRAVLFAIIGVALLLLFAFPRPYVGLLSLVPSIAGTGAALFVFSLFHQSISIIVLGFGGAIISMTVDYGIAYFLFLDRTEWSTGKEASHEVFSIGLLALLTTIGAFAALYLSGFPILRQLGAFTLLGVFFSFLFVHSVFPMIIPAIPPARPRGLPLQKLVAKVTGFGTGGGAVALGLALLMLFFVKPEFKVDIRSMNTVSEETAAADRLVTEVWGNVLNKVFLMVQGESIAELQRKGDILLKGLDAEISSGRLASGFVPSMIFPGEGRRGENLAAWRTFWGSARVSALKEALEEISVETGFAPSAFAPFYRTLEPTWTPEGGLEIPEELYRVFGIDRAPGGSSWSQMMTFNTGKAFDGERFYADHHRIGSVFEPGLFSERLSQLLFSTFLKMLVMVGAGVVILLFLFFAEIRLTVVSLLPILFAFICTLGTLNLLGYPLDFSTLMLPIIIVGLGIDFPLYFVRSYQRYEHRHHPSFGLIRTTVLMAAATTLIGFCALWSSEHNLLKSVGVTSALAIGYALAGTFLIVPPLMEFTLRDRENAAPRGRTPERRTLWRYRNMGPYPRLFARFKLMLDPMFKELPPILTTRIDGVRTIIDIGSGYGVPACWLLERFPGSTVYGIEPDPRRVAVASRAVGRRGRVVPGRAPETPATQAPAELATMLDMAYFLDEEGLRLTLERLHARMSPGGLLLFRVAISPRRRFPWAWWLENLKLKASRIPAFYRTPDEMRERFMAAGFAIEHSGLSGREGDLIWFVLRAGGTAESAVSMRQAAAGEPSQVV